MLLYNIKITNDEIFLNVRFICTDESDLNEMIVLPLLYTAHKYQVAAMVFRCLSIRTSGCEKCMYYL